MQLVPVKSSDLLVNRSGSRPRCVTRHPTTAAMTTVVYLCLGLQWKRSVSYKLNHDQ